MWNLGVSVKTICARRSCGSRGCHGASSAACPRRSRPSGRRARSRASTCRRSGARGRRRPPERNVTDPGARRSRTPRAAAPGGSTRRGGRPPPPRRRASRARTRAAPDGTRRSGVGSVSSVTTATASKRVDPAITAAADALRSAHTESGYEAFSTLTPVNTRRPRGWRSHVEVAVRAYARSRAWRAAATSSSTPPRGPAPPAALIRHPPPVPPRGLLLGLAPGDGAPWRSCAPGPARP